MFDIARYRIKHKNSNTTVDATPLQFYGSFFSILTNQGLWYLQYLFNADKILNTNLLSSKADHLMVASHSPW